MSVSLIDTATHAVVRMVAEVGEGVQHVAYAADGRHLHTADSGAVSVVVTATGAATARVPTGSLAERGGAAGRGRAPVTDPGDGTLRVLGTA